MNNAVQDDLNTLLSQAQSIRILQVQLADDVKDANMDGWERIDDYIAKTDEAWSMFNKAHKALWNRLVGE